MWDKVKCPNCNMGNWVNFGDTNDQTIPDVESVECYNCGNWFWLSEEFIEEVYWSEIEDGETLDSLLKSSYPQRGRKNPDDPYESNKRRWNSEYGRWENK